MVLGFQINFIDDSISSASVLITFDLAEVELVYFKMIRFQALLINTVTIVTALCTWLTILLGIFVRQMHLAESIQEGRGEGDGKPLPW